MPALEAAIKSRRRESPRRIAEEARTTLDNLPALRAAYGKSEAAQEARRVVEKCLGEIADLCLDDGALPPPPDLPASAGLRQKLNAVVAWGARANRNLNKSGKRGKRDQPNRTPSRPPKHYLLAYQIAVAIPTYTQQQIADEVTRQLKLKSRMSQQAVATALNRVGKFYTSQGIRDPIGEEKEKTAKRRRQRPLSVDPAELDAAWTTGGKRVRDGRTLRPPKTTD